MQAFLAQLLQASQRLTAHQQLQHFVEHARGRHVIDERRHHRDRRAGVGIDREVQFRREAHHAQQAHRIFAEARLRHADHAQRLVADIGDAAMVIEHHLGGRIVIHGVDGEVAPDGVFMLFAEGIVTQYAAVLILGRTVRRGAAESGHFQLLLSQHHMHDLEPLADDEGAPEQALDLFRRGVGRDVEILGLDPEQQVAHRAADHEGLEAGILQCLRDAHGVRRQQLRIDAMFLWAEYHGLAAIDRFFRGAEYAADELFNH